MRSLKEMQKNSLEVLKTNVFIETKDKNFNMAWDILTNESIDKLVLISVILKLKNKHNISNFEIEAMIEDAI